MPKRQRAPRYATVAAEAESTTPSSDAGRSTPKRMPRSGHAPSVGPSTSPSATTPVRQKRVSPSRRNGGDRPRSSSRNKPRANPKRPKKHMAAEEILLELLKACENHHSNCHPGYHPKNTNECQTCEEDLPASCLSAIKNLRVLIPKLESTIAPTKASGDKIETPPHSKDVSHLCLFYDNVVRGNYCPHMPHILGCGKDLKLILDKILYLLRNSLTICRDNADGCLDVISRTISGLISFAVDDSLDHVRKKFFVDWIDLAEDLSVLSTMELQSLPDELQQDGSVFPVELILFEESSIVVEQRARSQEKNDLSNEVGGAGDCKCSLRVHGLEQVRVLQIIVWRALHHLTSNGCALERLQTTPEHRQQRDALSSIVPLLMGGDVDLCFPSDLVTDLNVMSSLLAGIKPILLHSPHETRSSNVAQATILDRTKRFGIAVTTAEILIRMCLDWHRLGTSRIGIPLLPCLVDTASLITRAANFLLSDSEGSTIDGEDEKVFLLYEKRLAFLLDCTVCHPPGVDNQLESRHYENRHSLLQTIHSAVWTTLLHSIQGIARRVRKRRQEANHGRHQPGLTGERSNEPYTSPFLLDLAVLETIHFIGISNPSLALAGSRYSTARGIFSDLFFLSSVTSWGIGNPGASHFGTEEKHLMRLANKSLAVFLHASSVEDASSARLFEYSCDQVFKRQCHNVEELGFEGQAKNTDLDQKNAGEETSLNFKERHNSDGNLRYGTKRKRDESHTVHSSKNISIETKLDISYPVIWYDALACFFNDAFDAARDVEETHRVEVSSKGPVDPKTKHRNERVSRLSSALQLCLSLVRKFLTSQSPGKLETVLLRSISRLALNLAKKVRGCSMLLLGSLMDRNELANSEVFAMLDSIIGCGFSMLFTPLERRQLDHPLGKYIPFFLDAISSLSGRIIELGSLQIEGEGFICSKCTGVPTYLSGASGCQNYCHPLCLAVKRALSCNETNSKWLYEQADATLQSFPLFVQAALFSSLSPVEPNEIRGLPTNHQNSTTGFQTLRLFVDIFNQYAKQNKSSRTFYSSSHISSLMHFLPLMMMAGFCGKDIREIHRKQLCSGGSTRSQFTEALSLLVKDGLHPLLQSVEGEDDFILQSLFIAIREIQKLNAGGSLLIQIKDPVSVLNFITTRHSRLVTIERKKDEISSNLRGMLLFIAKLGRRRNPDTMTRYVSWLSAASYCIASSPSDMRQITTDSVDQEETESNNRNEKEPIMSWLVVSPLSDPNTCLRKFLLRELPFLMMSREYSFLLARFSSNKDFQEYCTSHGGSRMEENRWINSLAQVPNDVAQGMFEEIDFVLNEKCGISEAQLSLPLGREERRKKRQSSALQQELFVSVQHTVLKMLASVCIHAGTSHPIGKAIFEKAVLRMIRMWAATSMTNGEGIPRQGTGYSIGGALAFGGLSSLSASIRLSTCLSDEIQWTYLPSALFCDVLILNNRKNRQDQFDILETMMTSFLVQSQDTLQKKKSIVEARKAFNESIPAIIAQLVNEQDEETVKLIICFSIFFTEKYDSFNKHLSKDAVNTIGVCELLPTKKSQALTMGSKQIAKRTKDICLQKIEKILPLVLQSDQEEAESLKFLMRLTSPVTLPEMMGVREQRILLGIAWELGRDGHHAVDAVRALRTAALASGKNSTKRDEVESMPGTLAVRLWVTKHFMYLIVNMVQMNWASRRKSQQVQALRSLHVLLDFLDPSEATQYFPQILAAVNVAVTVDTDTGHTVDESLRFHAVQCLSKFIRLVVMENEHAVIDNLTTIVVSLLPIIEEEGAYQLGPASKDARIEAISILEFLTRAHFVRKFSRAFSQIPFLPNSTGLENIHKSLKDNGVDFDNLSILSTGASDSQPGILSRRQSLSSEHTSDTISSTKGDNVLALQNRLSLVYSLLDNENCSVRKVSLNHLLNLLRANRSLFHTLVESEGSTSIENYLTITYEGEIASSHDDTKHSSSVTGVTVACLIERLMKRCVHEPDARVRQQLAACLGEIGAIGENHLGDMSRFRSKGSESMSMYQWRLNHPPWQSRAVKYKLQLVTKYLVAALKAAPSQEEQLKIAFTIQQLLVLLDKSVEIGNEKSFPKHHSDFQKREMSRWLMDRLMEANVYETIEPFWLSEFSTKDERHSRRQPPFFGASKSYHLWLSEFCRWMIIKSKECTLSRWKDFFYACRIAVRSLSGLETAEFIMPLLVLDRICFGSIDEFESICNEFILVLDFDSNLTMMDSTERQKAVGGFFAMIDTLSYWAEMETEQRYRSKRSIHSKRSSRTNARQNHENSSNWPADETITQIQELISRVPLIIQARAATKVGMHAKALVLLEMLGRKDVVGSFFESSSTDDDKGGEIPSGGNIFQNDLLQSIDLTLMKGVLSSLDDCETMNVIGESSYLTNPLLQVTDTVQWKEASGDHEGALRDYDRILHIRNAIDSKRESWMERGALECMMRLGRFDEVMNRVINHDKESDLTKAFAVEAACHLGQWDRVSNVVDEYDNATFNIPSDDSYRLGIGKLVQSLRGQAKDATEDAIERCRNAVMENLSGSSQESYSKAYADIVKLHCIREFEDFASIFSSESSRDLFALDEIAESKTQEGWDWGSRLQMVTPRAASTILNTRIVIARLCEDRLVEGSLMLTVGKQAHKSKVPTVAEQYFSKAEATLSGLSGLQSTQHQKLDRLFDDVRVQYAKFKKDSGETLLALKILGQEMVEDALNEMNQNKVEDVLCLKKIAINYERSRSEKLFGTLPSTLNDKELVDRFANRLLRLTQWSVEAGMHSGSDIISRYQTVIKLSEDWEKGRFHFAKYLNNLVTRLLEKTHHHGDDKEILRFESLFRDRRCQQYILLAIENYAETLKLDMRHVYQALPRLLSLWFDFVSVKIPESDVSSDSVRDEYKDFLRQNQTNANRILAENIKSIPVPAFYTAMPQLISRVVHSNHETEKVVNRILERVLSKFPHQAMWHLAWLKGSKNSGRSKNGRDIFRGAQKVFIKNRQMQVANLLKASESLFKFLQDLARLKANNSTITVKPWKGIVHISEFIPPVQAALSISPFKPVDSNSREYFPRIVPRIRALSPKITVMMSKAKPKKLKAFAVPGTWKYANSRDGDDGSETSSPRTDSDIGEIHFLVKQEAKGDLRKDARVQDLNNVINRLMTSSSNSNSTLASRSQRLRVRTFTVTCLSEDTGILEWVPDTDSLRNLVCRSYNAQTSPFCARRRGSRICNFADATLRSNFERAQNQFWKSGDIPQAAKLFYLLCLKPNPPLLSWWFVQHFPSATDWYEARKKFTLTAAAWSSIGHVIGLGDRHSENILIETTTGRVIHVDFDCIFDKGLNLPRPEVVPFRLTPNMLDAFGPTGASGMFSSGMECSLGILRGNRDTLLSVLEPFIKDPIIDWKKHRTQQNITSGTRDPNDSHGEAKRSIHVIKERLSGICNLRNPNYRKLRNVIPREQLARLEQDSMTIEILPLSVEGQVQKLCLEASKNENLVQLYVGWMPWV